MQKKYSILRLNVHSDSAWAVIEASSGRIVVDASGNLFMRLTKSEASALARSMTDGPPAIPTAILSEAVIALPI